MKAAPFAYLRARSAREAIDALAEHGEAARVLAGGQSLVAVLAMRLAAPELLVDISRADDLATVRVERDRLCVGAAVTQATVEWRPGLAREVPLLALALPWLAHFQIRNRGTLCGSIAHADPSAELPLVLATTGGEVVLASRAGERVLAAEQFFQGMLTTARRADELVREVRFPLAVPGAGYGFEEFALRHGDFAIVAAAAMVTRDSVRLGIGGVADRPTVRVWPRHEGKALDDALNALAWSLDAQDDQHASAKLRRSLVRTLGRRAIERAMQAASAGPAPEQPPRDPPRPSGGRAQAASATNVARDARAPIRLTLNGVAREAFAEPRRTLCDFLREDLGATGTHVGCEHGVCGACTVRVDGVASRACLMFAVQADGTTVETVEGLAARDGTLGDLQQAFRRHHALQCGFCTAGILMSAADYLERVPAPTEDDVRAMLSGHLCRCTGYTNIVRAILEVASARAEAAKHA